MLEALMFLMMPWPLSWCFSLLPPDVFLQDDVTAGQNAPQRSLSSQQEAAVRMLFPRPLQQVLEENGEKISRNLPEKLLHCLDYLQISRVASSALSVFKMLWTWGWPAVSHTDVPAAPPAAADSPECGSGSCVCETQVPTAGRAVSFPLSPSGRSVETISTSTCYFSGELDWWCYSCLLYFTIPASSDFSQLDLVGWTPARGTTPGWSCIRGTCRRRLSGKHRVRAVVSSVGVQKNRLKS